MSVGVPREASVQRQTIGLERETGDEAAAEAALVILDIGEAPARGRSAELDGGGELTVALPAPDRVLRDAEALCNLLGGKVKVGGRR